MQFTKGLSDQSKHLKDDKNVRTGRRPKLQAGPDGRNAWKQLRTKVRKGSLQSKEKKANAALKSNGQAGAPRGPKSISSNKMFGINPEPTRKFLPVSEMIDPIQTSKEHSTMMDMTVAQKWKLPAIKGADAKRGGFFDSSIGGFGGGFKRSSDTMIGRAAPEFTLSILTDIAQQKKKRVQQELRDKLDGINNRVKDALMNAGIDADEVDVKMDKKLAGTLQMISMESRNKRQKIDERRNILGNINEYLGSCKERYGLLDNVATWIGVAQDELEKELMPSEGFDQAMTEADIAYNDTTNDMYIFTENIERFKNLSQHVLQHVRKILDKKEKYQAPKIVVLDDHTLLSGKIKWETGIASVTKLLEESSKWVKGIQLRNAIKNGKKQHAFIVKAMDKKLNELAIATKNFEDSKIKLSLAGSREERYIKDQSEARREMLTLRNALDDLTNQLRMAQERNDKLLLKVGKLEIVVRDLKEELAKLPPTPPPIIVPEPQPEIITPPPPPKTPTPPPPPQVDPSITIELNERIEELEDEISDFKVMIGELQDRIMMLENNVVKEQSKIKTLRANLDKTNKALSLAQKAPPPPAPHITPELKMEIKMEIQPPDTSVGSGSNNQQQQQQQDGHQAFKLSEASANYYKTLLSGMKKDFIQEMDRLKEHVKKEGNRTEAAVRRVEHSHKDQLAVIQKDAIRILRALMHFRDQLAIALEKEGHPEPAAQLHKLPKLIPEDVKTDSKEILSRMSIGCVEFLHGMESILSHTLMTIRVMSKFNSGQGSEGGVFKQMRNRVEKIQRGKTISKNTVERLKTKRKKLEKQKEDFKADQNGMKYDSLVGRYKIVWNMFLNMTKEMNILEEDFEETLDEVAENADPVMISAMKIEAKKFRERHRAARAGGEDVKSKDRTDVQGKKQVNYISHTKNTKRNLQKLEKAFDEGKIKDKLFEKSKKSLKECLSFPEKRFQSLVKSYVKFKALKQFDERSKKLLSEDVYLPKVKRRDLQKLTKKIHTRLVSELTEEQNVRDNIIEKLNEVNKQTRALCNDILIQTGIQLIQPKYIQKEKELPIIKHEPKTERKPKKEICYILRTEKTKANIGMLEKALEDGRIKYDLFEKSKKSLKECLSFPEKRFQSLVKRFVKFKALKQFDERGKKLLGGDVYLPTAKRQDLQKLTQKIHTRLVSELTEEQIVRDEINEELNEVNKEAWTICNAVTAQTGIQLMQPIMVQIDKGDHLTFPRLALQHQRRRARIIHHRQTMRPLELPSQVKGKNITLRNKLFYVGFKIERPRSPESTMVTTPLIVDLEVNKDRNTAKRVLTKRERCEIPLARTRSYHVTQDWRLRYINEVAYS